MIRKRATLADVATAAGVSMMTVSRAINHKAGISEETRQRIVEIADQFGYRPSGVARALATRRSYTVGLVMPDVSNPFFAEIARGADDLAHPAGYNLFLVNTDEDAAREIDALDMLLEKQVDGVILCSSRLPQAELQTYLGHFPATVLINREIDPPLSPHTATLNVDDQFGAQMAVAHFVAEGHARIGLIAGPESSVSAQRRVEGYRQGLQAAGLMYGAEDVVRCTPDTAGGDQAARRLLAQRPDLTAILAFNDLVAVGVVQACEALGRRVPEDISVMGTDDIPLATLVRPRLSTLRTEKRVLGGLAMEMLMALFAGEAERETLHRVLQPALVVRETTRKIPPIAPAI